VLNRLLNFISERGSQNITVFGLYSLVYTTRSIFGTARLKLVPKNQKSGTVPKIERSVNGAYKIISDKSPVHIIKVSVIAAGVLNG
jgi:hypothetical protein